MLLRRLEVLESTWWLRMSRFIQRLKSTPHIRESVYQFSQKTNICFNFLAIYGLFMPFAGKSLNKKT